MKQAGLGGRPTHYKPTTIARRVGRLLERNTRSAGLFRIYVVEDEQDGRARLAWERNETWRNWASLSEGCYLLRNWSAEELWRAYMQLTEAEAAFRIQKADLPIRPIWHQKEERVQAHILACFLVYALWKTLAGRCRASGLGDEPRRVFAELSKVKVVDVVLPTRRGVEIRRRCVTQPSKHQAILLDRLGLSLPNSIQMTRL